MSIKYVLRQGQRSKGRLFGKLPRAQTGTEAEKRGERGPGAALQRGLARTQGTPGRGVGFTPESSAERLTGVAHPFAHTAPPPPAPATCLLLPGGLTAGRTRPGPQGAVLLRGDQTNVPPSRGTAAKRGGWRSRAPRLRDWPLGLLGEGVLWLRGDCGEKPHFRDSGVVQLGVRGPH